MEKNKWERKAIWIMVGIMAVMIAASFLHGCKQHVEVESLSSSIIIQQAKPIAPVGEWPNQTWNDILYAGIDQYGRELLLNEPKDFASFCSKKFFDLTITERKQFYLTLISSLARYESGFNPKATYTEGFTDRNGKRVISAGVLQLSVESGRGYGCPLKVTADLFDVKQNLECGVRIANRWIGQRDHVITVSKSPWLGMARYWSPFRNDLKRAALMKKTKALSFCSDQPKK